MFYPSSNKGNLHRSIGVLLTACGALCGWIAWDVYSSRRRTAIKIAEAIEGIEFRSVTIPASSIVTGLVAVVLVVAGIKCLIDSRVGTSGDQSDLI